MAYLTQGCRLRCRPRLILDTESSVCPARRRRVLVSLAYEVVDPQGQVLVSRYEVVSQPIGFQPDPVSVAVHGLDSASTQEQGQPLDRILHRLFTVVRTNQPTAVVGHDIVGDISLLVSETIVTGVACDGIPLQLTRLLCTRMLTTHLCALPLPARTMYRWV